VWIRNIATCLACIEESPHRNLLTISDTRRMKITTPTTATPSTQTALRHHKYLLLSQANTSRTIIHDPRAHQQNTLRAITKHHTTRQTSINITTHTITLSGRILRQS